MEATQTLAAPGFSPDQGSEGSSKAPRLKPRQLARRYWVDLLLLALAGLFFSLFVLGSVLSQKLSGLNAPVATLVGGSAERKKPGSTEYERVELESEFFNMDAVWVGKGRTAVLRLDDGKELHLKERTLVVLKKPFRSGSIFDLQDNSLFRAVRDVVEKVTAPTLPDDDERARIVKAKEVAVVPSGKPLPSVEERAETHRAPQRVSGLRAFPAPDIVLYYRITGSVKLRFAWPEAVTGKFVLRNKKTREEKEIEFEKTNFLDVDVAQDSDYVWQIVDHYRQIILGPLSFKLRTLKQGEKPDVGPGEKLEIHW